MKISEMSDEELSRLIANHIEPLSSLPGDDDMDKMEDFPCECWIATFRLSKVTGLHVPCWVPQDMVGDAEMTLMLLDRCREHIGSALVAYADGWRLFIYNGEGQGDTETRPLGRAVAESFAFAHNLVPERKEVTP